MNDASYYFFFIMTSQSHTMSWRNKGNQDIPGFYSGTEGWQFSVSSEIVNLPANLFVGRVPLRATSLLDDLHQFLSFLDLFFVHRRTPTPKDSEQRRNIGWQYSTSVEFCQPLQRIESSYHCVFQSLQDFTTILHLCASRIIRDKIYLRQ